MRGLVSCFAILAFTAVAVVALSFLKPSLPHPAPIAWLPGGCAILEFMALGAPTVTTERIGRRETVMEGCNGFLAPIRHNQCMTARLRDLVLDKALRCRMGAESCRMATDVFGEGVVAHRIFSDLYELADEAQTG
ncbi:MAG: glycosyltransferase [Alphaproteobacteria bacterium]